MNKKGEGRVLFSHQIVVQSRMKHLIVIVEASIRVIIIVSKGIAMPLRIIPINILPSDSEDSLYKNCLLLIYL